MRAIASVLDGGLRLSLLLAPRRTPLDCGVGTFLFTSLLLAAVGLAWEWRLFDPPRTLNGFGLQTWAMRAMLALAASALLCALCDRRALFWTVAGWLQASMLLPTVLLACVGLAGGWEALLSPWVWGAAMAWTFAILLRLAWFLTRSRVGRGLAAPLAAAVLLLPWLVLQSQLLWTTDWQALSEDTSQFGDGSGEPGELADPEAAMYALGTRLDAAAAALAPQRPGTVDMYVLAFGGDAGEDVFRNEVEYIERLFPQRFDAAGRVLGLLNHPDSVATRPLATATNLERGLVAIGERIDAAEDIVFVYLTSHGSEDHELYVNQPPLPFDQITPLRLRAALDASGIRWRVVVVSACFSGGFIEALRDPQTLVITAARADRTSFGCGSESDITWFGNAFVAEALNRTADLRAAFDLAAAAIAEREAAEEFDPSEPQWDAGERILAQLDRWRAGFTPGAALPFVPPPDTQAAQAAAGDAEGAAGNAVPARTASDDTPDDEPANAVR